MGSIIARVAKNRSRVSYGSASDAYANVCVCLRASLYCRLFRILFMKETRVRGRRKKQQ